jgi:glycosyltransferase involved in cell wall biosynthesis
MTEVGDLSQRPIAILIPTVKGGGAEFVALTWAHELRSRGRECHIVTYAESQGGEHSFSIDSQGALKHIHRIRRLRKYLHDHDPSTVISLLTYSNILCLLAALVPYRRRGLKIAISERNMPTAYAREHGSMQRLLLHLAKVLYRRADFGLAISHPVAAEMTSKFNMAATKVVIQPNPALAKVREQAFAYKVTGRLNSLSLVVPGRIEIQKNPKLAIDVAATLTEMGEDVRVIFFGEGDLKPEVVAHATSCGVTATFPGWHDQWFAACPKDALILLPSSYEGFGNVLVEAAALGIPSVASSAALGLADAVIDGLTAILSPTLRPDDLANAVLAARVLMIDDRINGWLKKFDPSVSTSRLLSAIGEEESLVARS